MREPFLLCAHHAGKDAIHQEVILPLATVTHVVPTNRKTLPVANPQETMSVTLATGLLPAPKRQQHQTLLQASEPETRQASHGISRDALLKLFINLVSIFPKIMRVG
jgi:hypothetical protein